MTDNGRQMRFEDARNIRHLNGLIKRKVASLLDAKEPTIDDWQQIVAEIQTMVESLETTTTITYGDETAPPIY